MFAPPACVERICLFSHCENLENLFGPCLLNCYVSLCVCVHACVYVCVCVCVCAVVEGVELLLAMKKLRVSLEEVCYVGWCSLSFLSVCV